jgi:hypothetical protein
MVIANAILIYINEWSLTMRPRIWFKASLYWNDNLFQIVIIRSKPLWCSPLGEFKVSLKGHRKNTAMTSFKRLD